MPEPVPLELAASVDALHERIGNTYAVSRATGVPPSTVRDIIKGYGRWHELTFDSSFVALRTEQKRILQQSSIALAAKALSQIDATIDKASAAQSAMIYGILRDKERLDAGESTINIAVRSSNEITNLDSLADALRGELIKRKSP